MARTIWRRTRTSSSGAARGTNGLSSANLRGQGSASTLVLLNGRRVAAHGLQGSAVDVNQIPFAAIDRIEVLKDGASAIYGTDAVGGVINFITKTNFTGVDVTGFVDTPEAGDAQIYRLSGTIGWGKLDEQGFNVMALGQQKLEQGAVRAGPQLRQRQPAQSRPVDRYAWHADRDRRSRKPDIGRAWATHRTARYWEEMAVQPRWPETQDSTFPALTSPRSVASMFCACQVARDASRWTAE